MNMHAFLRTVAMSAIGAAFLNSGAFADGDNWSARCGDGTIAYHGATLFLIRAGQAPLSFPAIPQGGWGESLLSMTIELPGGRQLSVRLENGVSYWAKFHTEGSFIKLRDVDGTVLLSRPCGDIKRW